MLLETKSVSGAGTDGMVVAACPCTCCCFTLSGVHAVCRAPQMMHGPGERRHDDSRHAMHHPRLTHIDYVDPAGSRFPYGSKVTLPNASGIVTSIASRASISTATKFLTK